MDKRALGKGLSALIPEKTEDTREDAVAYVSINTIQDNEQQPRHNYDDLKMEELKASIREKGVLQPILVRRKKDGFEVIAGERRLKAARALNIQKIPVIIKNVTDQEAFMIALIENIQREELNPIEEAEAYRKLIEDFQYTHDDLSKSVGKDRSTITNMLRLLKLPDDLKEGLFTGEISTGHARALLGAETAMEARRLFKAIVQKGLSVREVELLIKRGRDKKETKASQKQAKDHEVIALEDELKQILGTKVTIQHKKKRGKLIIEYYSLDDLDRILKILKK